MALDLFRKKTLSDMARGLGLKPFDVVRILAQEGEGLPATLLFEEETILRVREIAGVEIWWDPEAPLPVEDSHRSRALVRSLAHKLLAHHQAEAGPTRADNLFRGLEGADQLLIRRAVNQMIREGFLQSLPAASGLHILVDAVYADTIAGVADGSSIPDNIEALWS